MKKQYLLLLLPVGLCAAALFLHRETPPETQHIPAASEEERTAFLRSEGWEGTLLSSQTVTVPQTEDGVWAEYAGLQRRLQLPLDEYAGAQAELYTYTLQGTELCAELLTADGILIGAQCYAPETHVTLDLRGNAP